MIAEPKPNEMAFVLPIVDGQPRRLNLAAVPTRTEISNIEFDVTLDCNLRCLYCYKGEVQKVNMPRRVAFDAVIWLIYASGKRHNLRIYFLGGEPLMNYSLIKELIPFGVTRARQHGKKLTFGMTTNCTMVTDEVVSFFRRWGATFHTSFDGIPEIQDHNRPTATGAPSSPLVEAGAKRILAYQPQVTARCTFNPDSAPYLFENYKYFRSLGYKNIVMIPALTVEWPDDVLAVVEEGYTKIAEYWMAEFKKGTVIYFKQFNEHFISRNVQKRGTVPCGAGRGYGMINANGDYFPCSRWGIHEKVEWSFGNIYEGFYEDKRSDLLKGFPQASFLPECATCAARCVCKGGCLAENLDATASPFTVIPCGCEIRKIWTKVGEMIYQQMVAEKNADFIARYCSNNKKSGNKSAKTKQPSKTNKQAQPG